MYKRDQERFKPEFLIKAFNLLDDELLGSIVNISMGGFMLSSHGSPFPDGAIFQLILKEEPAGMEINIGATCLWQTEANAPDSYWSGFQIIDISEEDTIKLKSYLSDLE